MSKNIDLAKIYTTYSYKVRSAQRLEKLYRCLGRHILLQYKRFSEQSLLDDNSFKGVR